jgi:hypothetical protein
MKLKFLTALPLLCCNIFVFVALNHANAQPLVTCDGLALTFQSGLVATVQGAFTNQTKGTDLGTTDNAGTITLTGNWTNNSANTVFSTNTGLVQFIGTTAQTIGGSNSTGFDNLVINNTFATSPQITLAVNTIAKNNLAMTLGNTNLAGFTMTLGTAAITPGTLTYTVGWLYGGTFTRWFDNITANTIPSSVGHFPTGTSTVDYRPLWLGYSAVPTTGGTISVVHNPTYPSGTTPTNHSDPSWGNSILEGISYSSWVVSTANGFTSSGSNLSLRLGGTGFGALLPNDLNLTLATSVVGIFAPETNVNIPVEVNRNGLSTANLSNTFFIGTRDSIGSLLPIELINFDAKCDNGKVNLNWKTASEFDNDYFTIERSGSAINWQTIGRVTGAGNSSRILNYSFIDTESLEGVLYYRLKQTDFNVLFKYSNIVAVTCENNDFSAINIYPNPNTGRFTIDGVKQNAVLIIFNTIGEKITEQNISSEKTEIYLSNLPNGIYFVQISSERESVIRKISINK